MLRGLRAATLGPRTSDLTDPSSPLAHRLRAAVQLLSQIFKAGRLAKVREKLADPLLTHGLHERSALLRLLRLPRGSIRLYATVDADHVHRVARAYRTAHRRQRKRERRADALVELAERR